MADRERPVSVQIIVTEHIEEVYVYPGLGRRNVIDTVDIREIIHTSNNPINVEDPSLPQPTHPPEGKDSLGLHTTDGCF